MHIYIWNRPNVAPLIFRARICISTEKAMPKHLKREATDADLRRNPMIGGSKGTTIAGITTDDLQEFQGANTMEGDDGNGTNAQGGIDKAAARGIVSRKRR
jgi:hypothetical protein